jgi:hypothetical protein
MSHYANFQRDRIRSGWKKAFFATIGRYSLKRFLTATFSGMNF